MGWLARAMSIGAALLVGCASIAGLEEPLESEAADSGTGTQTTPAPGTSSGSSGTSGSSGSSGSSGTTSSGGTTDSGTSPADSGADTAPPPPPPCTKAKIDDSCNANADCCSNACGNSKKCVTSCRSLGSTCSGDGACCVNTRCSNIFLCAPQ